MSDKFLSTVFRKAAFCRHFEKEVYSQLQEKKIRCPTYLSAGQEYISATIATLSEIQQLNPLIFIQHRGHSTYLSFGADPKELIDELLGRESGCAGGMGGSASIHSPSINLFGHDGLMGSHVPIAVGASYASKRPAIVFLGDASAEEDYVLGALGWASTKNLPILFVVEDNNLSILTKKRVRRNWEMVDVAKGLQLRAVATNDDPKNIRENLAKTLPDGLCSAPCLINVSTNRMFWHAGAGTDGEVFDRHETIKSILGSKGNIIDDEEKQKVSEMWQECLIH